MDLRFIAVILVPVSAVTGCVLPRVDPTEFDGTAVLQIRRAEANFPILTPRTRFAEWTCLQLLTVSLCGDNELF